MTTPQNLIDELRSFVHSSDQTLTDEMKEVAAQYAAVCREVNQRLARCLDHLKRGLRSEAIHLAQGEPVLLEQLASLDFPERPQWEEITALYGLPSAPVLNVDAARALNEAYAEEQPLEDLLKRHRLLALSRAALPARLGILRRIASMDTLNPVWADDVREFERARLRQMHQEVEEATKRGDNGVVAALAEEMRTSRWSVELPAGLFHHLEAVGRQHAQKKAMTSLLELESELNGAISAFDVGKARRLREPAQGLVKSAGLRPGDPVLERLSYSLAWVDEQDRREAEARKHERAEQDLIEALDVRANREELERIFQSIARLGRGLSAPLEARYQQRLKDLDDAVRRKKRLILIGSGLAAVLVLGLSIWWIHRSVQANRIQEARASIQGLLKANRVGEAKTAFNDLTRNDAGTANAAELADVRLQLQKAEKADQQRKQQFRDGLKEVADLKASKLPDGLVERVKKLVQTPEEEQQLTDALRDWDRRRQQEALAHEQKLRGRLSDLELRGAALEKLLQQPRRELEARKQLIELDRDADQLEREVKGVSNELHAAVRGLAGRLDRVRKELDERSVEQGLLEELTKSLVGARSAAPYAALLLKHAQRFPESGRGASFKRAADEERIWDGVLAWNHLMSPAFQQPLSIGTKEAKGQADKCAELLKAFPQFPDHKTATDYQRAVAALAARDHDNKSGAVEDLKRLFSDALVRDVYTVRTLRGELYYVVTDPQPDIRQKVPVIQLKVLVDFGGKSAGVTLKLQDIKESKRSPQSIHAQNVLSWLSKLDKTWEASLVELLQDLMKDEELDAVLRFKLVQNVLNYAAKGSYPLGLALAEHRDHVTKAGVDTTVLWMRSGDPVANNMRPQALKSLRQLPTLGGVLKEAENRRQDLVKRIGMTRLSLTGWLVNEAGLGWQCRVAVSLPRTGELLAAAPQEPDQPAAWQVVGKVQDGKAVLDSTSGALLEGRLVFVRPSP